MSLCPFTDEELATLSQVVLTSNTEWDPTILDSEWQPDDLSWYQTDSMAPVYTVFDTTRN